LIDQLGGGPWAVDTAPFIYLIEDHPHFAPQVAPVFAEAATGSTTIVTSALTLLEVLVVPLRQGRDDLCRQYEDLLTESRNVLLTPLDLAVLREAARLRARANLSTPDALQLATAIVTGCTSLLTGDRRIRPVAGLKIVHLSPP
jgi:predicted nucleic acid-binding protein